MYLPNGKEVIECDKYPNVYIIAETGDFCDEKGNLVGGNIDNGDKPGRAAYNNREDVVWITKTGMLYYANKTKSATTCIPLSEALRKGMTASAGYNRLVARAIKNKRREELKMKKKEESVGNINTFIFTRTAPKKKLEVINELSEEKLLSVKLSTIDKIVREVGYARYAHSPNKELYLEGSPGNNWNSDVESLAKHSRKLFIHFYLQYDNTDTTVSDYLWKFLEPGEYRGKHHYSDRYGNGQTTYFRYDNSDKAKVIRSILKTYVLRKYKDKL